MYFGTDYYPEHWPEGRWVKDAQLMKEANINIVRLAEFAWVKLEPENDNYDFGWLDKIINILAQHDIRVILGTPTATPPKWLMDEHPDMYMKNRRGITRGFGSRITRCHNNLTFQFYTKRIINNMVVYYNKHPFLAGWQIDNEFGCHNTTRCYCESCLKIFREWLENKYQDIDNLNKAWGTSFWSQSYGHFSEVILPGYTTCDNAPHNHGHNPGLLLDYYRFASDSIIKYQKIQIDEIRKHSDKPITHNFMGMFDQIDYYKLGRDLDIVSHDNYPAMNSSSMLMEESISQVSCSLDVIRGIKNQNFILMEQQSGPIGWSTFSGTPKPGQIRLWTYQAIAHGAEGILYYRWRPCLYGTEQYWYGILDHDGIPRRRYREIQNVGAELENLSDWIVGSQNLSDVAILRHYDNCWSHHISPHTAKFNYDKLLLQYYGILNVNQINVDITNVNRDLSKYKLIFAPALNLMDISSQKKLEDFVFNGGNLVVTFRSGTRNKDNSMTTTPLPGYFRDLTGIEVEEFYPVLGENQKIKVRGQIWENDAWFESKIWCDIIKVIDSVKTRVIARYDSEFFRGKPAITANQFGSGVCYYIGCDLDSLGLNNTIRSIVGESRVSSNLPSAYVGIESVRKIKKGRQFLMVFNHKDNKTTVKLPGNYTDLIKHKTFSDEISLDPYDVVMLISSG
jgi:beta-galactosidase